MTKHESEILSDLPDVVGTGAEESQRLQTHFAGASPASAPWQLFIYNPDLVSFISESALSRFVPWLLHVALVSPDVSFALANRVRYTNPRQLIEQNLAELVFKIDDCY